ncbi:MAG TPA: isoleucine--tRNA ligase, partial [Myxococcaceae bacterium]|nr:isoleucine--tRNA ligase [Myxococcaceae bacterium]
DLLYRRKKPVYWCITDQTALAEAEVEYEDHTSPSVYVAMDATGDLGRFSDRLKGRKVAFVIWTTTPWTLPANLAIAVHPNLDYVFYDAPPELSSGRVVVVAKDLLLPFLAAVWPDELHRKNVQIAGAGFDAAALAHPERILAYARGEDLEKLQYRHPFLERVSPVILGEHVTLEAGTGLVHTAPGHGHEDYEMGLKYGLDVYNPVMNDGRFDESVGPLLAGKNVWEANPIIVDLLAERGALLNRKGDEIRHSYPHCWRCHNPIIFAGTWQWFVALDKAPAGGELTVRQRALREIDQRIEWIPRWGRDRIYNMLENRPDWTISRQRTWGVPIPVAYCTGCGEPVVSAEMMERVAAAVEKEGTAVWYRSDPKLFLPDGHRCASCGASEVRRETDILDVWFDSACSFAAVAAKRKGLRVPVDLYLEGSDQHRGWFHSSLLVGVGTRDRAPYQACLTHGYVVDGEGRKMSKSLGNTISAEQMIQRYGAEILRLWVASSDYRDDVRLSEQILKGLTEGYRKIRNTLRYALSNLYDFDPARDAVQGEQLLPLDRWARASTADLVARVRRAYDAYEFHLVYHAVVEFCAMDLSAIYFDILKDRLYTAKATSKARRSAQTVLFGIARDLLRLLAPVTSFTSEEAWQQLPGEKAESVFLGGFPDPLPALPGDEELMQRFEKIFAVRSAVQGLLEAARRDKIIGSSLEARVTLHGTGQAKGFLESQARDLPAYFIVSQVDVVDAAPQGAQRLAVGALFGGDAEVSARVDVARGAKCPRCWTYSEAVAGGAPVCEKCQEALS